MEKPAIHTPGPAPKKKATQSKSKAAPADQQHTVDEYGFYEENNQYIVKRSGRDGRNYWERVSNFTMRILYLVQGQKRVVELANTNGSKVVIEMQISDLTGLQQFRTAVEGYGNFVFRGKGDDLAAIRSYLYSLERACIPVNRLGQINDELYAFANGIFTGSEWIESDDNGIVTYKNKNYYIPHKKELREDLGETSTDSYSSFIHKPGNTDWDTWTSTWLSVYGDNGKIALAFTFVALFSDVVYKQTDCVPILFLYGRKGSGKGSLVSSIRGLWGGHDQHYGLTGVSTPNGFMRTLSQYINGLIWLDEYKNQVAMNNQKVFESLKNIWDRIGVTRGEKSNDVKTNYIPILSAAIISGEEVPVDEALMSRLILCTFPNSKYTNEEIHKYNELEKLTESGLTHLTIEILKHREHVKQHFAKHYQEAQSSLNRLAKGLDVTTRVVKNYSILVGIYCTLEEVMSLPTPGHNMIDICFKLLSDQHVMAQKDDPVKELFETLYHLTEKHILKYGEDIIVTRDNELRVKQSKFNNEVNEHYVKLRRTRSSKQALEYAKADQAYLPPEKDQNGKNKKAKLGKLSTFVHQWQHNIILDNYEFDFNDFSKLPDI